MITDVSIPVSSVAGVKSTFARHTPGSVLTVVSAGQTMTGATPLTVTVKLQVSVLFAASVATNSTVVAPMGKVELLASPAVRSKVTPGQLSRTVGSGKVTVAPSSPVAVTVTSAGQVISGFSSSVTVTVNVHVLFPAEFVAVAVTVVVPTGKSVPAS